VICDVIDWRVASKPAESWRCLGLSDARGAADRTLSLVTSTSVLLEDRQHDMRSCRQREDDIRIFD